MGKILAPASMVTCQAPHEIPTAVFSLVGAMYCLSSISYHFLQVVLPVAHLKL